MVEFIFIFFNVVTNGCLISIFLTFSGMAAFSFLSSAFVRPTFVFSIASSSYSTWPTFPWEDWQQVICREVTQVTS